MAKVDSQRIEPVGTALFEAELTRQGFEVAKPRRDRGINRVVYTSDPSQHFRAVPVQLKVSTTTAFSLDRKHETFTALVVGYVWDIHTTPRFFLLTYPEAAVVAGEQALSTPSWAKSGYHAEGPIIRKRLTLLDTRGRHLDDAGVHFIAAGIGSSPYWRPSPPLAMVTASLTCSAASRRGAP